MLVGESGLLVLTTSSPGSMQRLLGSEYHERHVMNKANQDAAMVATSRWVSVYTTCQGLSCSTMLAVGEQIEQRLLDNVLLQERCRGSTMLTGMQCGTMVWASP